MIQKLVLVFLGGGLGSCSRYAVTLFLERAAPAALLPVGTVVVNLVGSFLIGLVLGQSWSSGLLLSFFVTGFLGGFTTFSALSWEAVRFGRDHTAAFAFGFVIFQVIFGVALCYLGLQIGMRMIRNP